jgi:ABC-type transport system substrate-binding protein
LYSEDGPNPAAYSDPKIGRLLSRARRETDLKERRRLLEKIQEEALAAAVYIFLGQEMRSVVQTAHLRGLKLHPLYPILLKPSALRVETPDAAAPALPPAGPVQLPSDWPEND